MLLHIPRVLTESQIARGRPLLEQAKWVDGRATAGHLSARAKHNLQVAEGTPEARELGEVVVTALERTPPELVGRTESLVGALGLPVHAPPGLAAADLLTIMKRDKKSGGGLTFVLDGPSGIERVDDPDPVAVNKALAAIGVSL